MKIKADWFVLSIIATILIAYFFPQAGEEGSKFPLNTISSIGVSLIFFFYGLKLRPDKLKAGLRNWKLHGLIQASTFIIFPVLVLAFYPFLNTAQSKSLWLALLFLAALPSTVSSSVVMVSIAKGNIPAAIFNASISGIIGIVLTPLWIGFFLTQKNTSGYDLTEIYFKLIVEILVPVFAGLFLQRYWGEMAAKYAKQLSLFDKSVILLIIYKSFAESFSSNIFSTVSLADLSVLSTAAIGLFFVVYFITGKLSNLLKLNTEDSITARFCGTKKSLVHGTVFAKILFDNAAVATGVMLLPLMLFHAFQIFFISIIAGRLGNRQTLN